MPIGRPRFPNRRSNCGLTKIEVIAVIATVGLLVSLLFPRLPRRSTTMQCILNLKNVGLAFRIFSTDHGDKFPMDLSITNGGAKEFGAGNAISGPPVYEYFRTLSNELSVPKVLVCPADTRKPVKSFSLLNSNTKVSYFIGLGASEFDPISLLAGDGKLTNQEFHTNIVNLRTHSTNAPPVLIWSKGIHDPEYGNIVQADGSVQQYSTPSLNQTLKDGVIGGSNQTLPLPYQPNGKW